MNRDEHKARHVELHEALMELVEDWQSHHPERGTLHLSYLGLMEWSRGQCKEPTEHMVSSQPMPDSVEIAGDTVPVVYLADKDERYQPGVE